MAEIDIVDIYLHKPPMEREVLREVITLSLFAGQLLLQNGADTKRVEETVHKLGTGLGCDWMDVAVFPDVIIASTVNNHEFRTKVRRAPSRGVNMEVIAQVTDLTYGLERGEITVQNLRQELRRIDSLSHNYNRWMIVCSVGLACAAFSKLFGGDWPVFFTTFVASSTAMFVRQELSRRYFSDLIVVAVTSFVATIIASVAYTCELSPKPAIALAACVLLLVPGVPMVASAEDLIHGYYVTGVARGFFGLLIVLAIAFGLSLAMWMIGIPGL